jgi:hypothetical protein
MRCDHSAKALLTCSFRKFAIRTEPSAGFSIGPHVQLVRGKGLKRDHRSLLDEPGVEILPNGLLRIARERSALHLLNERAQRVLSVALGAKERSKLLFPVLDTVDDLGRILGDQLPVLSRIFAFPGLLLTALP